MNHVAISCPHCDGAIQIDTAHAGQQVACPMCQGVMVVPNLSGAGDSGRGSNQPGGQGSGPGGGDTWLTFECPGCRSGFQVGASARGQTIQCPTCQQSVAIPEADPGATEDAPRPVADTDSRAAGFPIIDTSSVESRSVTPPPEPPIQPVETGSPSTVAPAAKSAAESKLPATAAADSKSSNQRLQRSDGSSLLIPPTCSVAIPNMQAAFIAAAAVVSKGEQIGGTAPVFSTAKPGETAAGRNAVPAASFVLRQGDKVITVNGEQHLLRQIPEEERSRRRRNRTVALFGIGATLLMIAIWILR